MDEASVGELRGVDGTDGKGGVGEGDALGGGGGGFGRARACAAADDAFGRD